MLLPSRAEPTMIVAFPFVIDKSAFHNFGKKDINSPLYNYTKVLQHIFPEISRNFQNITLLFFSNHCLLPLLTELYDFLNTSRKGKAAVCDSDFSIQRVNRPRKHCFCLLVKVCMVIAQLAGSQQFNIQADLTLRCIKKL